MGQQRRYRLYFAWNFQREEKWINQMAREKGLCLTAIKGPRYEFQECTPGAYQYCQLPMERTERDEAEKNYLKSIGAEEVCHSSTWVYWRKHTDERSFPQWLCADSKCSYLSRLFRRYLVFAAAAILALMAEIFYFPTLPHTAPYLICAAILFLLAFYAVLTLTRIARKIQRLKSLRAPLWKE